MFPGEVLERPPKRVGEPTEAPPAKRLRIDPPAANSGDKRPVTDAPDGQPEPKRRHNVASDDVPPEPLPQLPLPDANTRSHLKKIDPTY